MKDLSATPPPTSPAPGSTLPELVTRVGHSQLFYYSSASYIGHRVHYDIGWAVDVEGYPNVLVHGPLQVALAVKLVTDWIGPEGALESYQFQNRRSAYADELLAFAATVRDITPVGERLLVNLDVAATKDGGVVLMDGQITASLPSGARGSS